MEIDAFRQSISRDISSLKTLRIPAHTRKAWASVGG